MDRLISEQAVLDVINEAIRVGRFYCGKEQTIKEIKAIPSAEPTEEQIKAYIRKRKMILVEDDFMKHIIKGTSEAYKGMTNGEVLETIFPNAECDFKKFCEEDTVVFNLNGFYMRVSADWWNSLYDPQESEDTNG